MILLLSLALLLAFGLLFWLALRRPPAPDLSVLAVQIEALAQETRRIEQATRDELARTTAALRDELGARVDRGLQAMLERHDSARREHAAESERVRSTLDLRLAELHQGLTQQLEASRTSADQRLRESAETADQRLARLRAELSESAIQGRQEARTQSTEFLKAVQAALTDTRANQNQQLGEFSQRLAQLHTLLGEQLDRARQTIDARLNELQTQNATKLDEMRATVDQRLQSTLEQRLGESFKLVGDNLERVIRSLGEMQQIAAGVGDLKRVLTNVKTRGTWGEVQLAALLEQVLTADQYAANVAPKPSSAERVEFALKLPGHEPGEQPVWLPIDAKFPVEDYQRLAEAADRADPEAVALASAALANRVRDFAKSIAEKYLSPPHTTDFALLFLPTEGLYAEVIRQPGLADIVQRQHRVVIVGPTTLAALLNSLQMGFRTLAIQQRSSEVWTVLGAVKTEFAKFGDVLDKVKKKLESASSEIEQTGVRTRAITRRLREVEALPAAEAARLLPPLAESDPAEPAAEEST